MLHNGLNNGWSSVLHGVNYGTVDTRKAEKLDTGEERHGESVRERSETERDKRHSEIPKAVRK